MMGKDNTSVTASFVNCFLRVLCFAANLIVRPNNLNRNRQEPRKRTFANDFAPILQFSLPTKNKLSAYFRLLAAFYSINDNAPKTEVVIDEEESKHRSLETGAPNHNLVSVVIPTYNGERTIIKTVNSVLKQTYKPLQLIIIDDASKDSTVASVEGFVGESGFACTKTFKLITHDVNLGLSRSLNEGFKRANSDLVLVLHQDCELASNDWIERAMSFFVDEKVAVVTGYYGISDEQDETFVKRTFGVLRKQFHSYPKAAYEEATFCEGKCDLFRRNLLLEVGGFPVNFRIAGEDIVVSCKLRSLGYRIIKSFDLPVVQRFSGPAETFSGNLSKDFLFGKALGGVFCQFRFFLFKSVRNSSYSGSRALHRSSQPPFVLSVFILAILSFFAQWPIYLLIGLLLARWVYYFFRVYPELKVKKNRIPHPFAETIVASGMGILTDFAYGFGFGYGLLRYAITKRL